METGMPGWLLDSACTSHLCKDRTQFVQTSFQANSQLPAVLCANGGTLKIIGSGTVILYPTKDRKLILTSVLLVPHLHHNLISVSRLVDDGYSINFQAKKETCTIQKGLTHICSVPRVRNLWKLNNVNVPGVGTSAKTSYAFSAVTMEELHHKFGHASQQKLLQIIDKKCVDGITLTGPRKLKTCVSCALGKQRRHSMITDKDKPATGPLDLVHMDLMGPMSCKSDRGFIYAMTILDDYSRYCWTFLLRSKTEVFGVISSWLLKVENQSERTVKRIRADKGTEFQNRNMSDLCKERGIHQEFTNTASPQQNGLTERYNLTLMSSARCLLAAADFHQRWWGEAILCANYMKNQCPHSSLPVNTTPFERWHCRRPDIKKLHRFGGRVTVMKNKSGLKKLDYRSSEGRFLGYPQNTPGYRILLDSGKVVESSDVLFMDEDTPSVPTDLPSVPSISLPAVPEQHVDLDDDVSEVAEELPEESVEPPSSLLVEPREDTLGNPPQDNVIAPSPSDPQASATSAIPRRTIRQTKAPLRLTYDRLGNPTDASYFASSPDEGLADFDISISPSCFAVSALNDREPSSLEEAMTGPDRLLWKRALDEEMNSVEHHETYLWEPLPPGKLAVKSGLVFKIKPALDGKPERYKVRLIAKGYSQVEGLDYNASEIYAPVIMWKTLRITCALAVQMDLHIHKMDVKTAFLNGELSEEVYMEPPPGAQPPVGMENFKWRLKRSLYGLKQSPRIWNDKLDEYLVSLKFTRLESDYGMYIRGVGDTFVIITVYVDDILIATKDLDLLSRIKADFSDHFDMVDFGQAHSILGIHITRDFSAGTLRLDQAEYATEILRRFNHAESSGKSAPLSKDKHYSRLMCPETPSEVQAMSTVPYRQAVGSLMHLMVCTRPDLAYSVGVMCRYLHNPGQEHWNGVKHILQYVSQTKDLGLCYSKVSGSNLSFGNLQGYCDSDWAEDRDERESTAGWVVKMNGAAISWQSRKNRSPAQSSGGAEYVALGMMAMEVGWLYNILGELDMTPERPIPIFCDSEAAIHMGENPILHERSKHIELKWHIARYMVRCQKMSVSYIRSEMQIADGLTKSVTGPDMEWCCKQLGLTQVATSA